MSLTFHNVLLVLLIKNVLTSYSDSFTEELLLKPLYSNQLYAHFQFVTKWDSELASEQCKFWDFHQYIFSNELFFVVTHTHLFPRAIGELIQRYELQELHVSLTGGLWRYEQWGYPVIDAAPGAEVWAWFKPGTKDIDKNWKLLANSLSGLLCASMNFIDTFNSINPQYTFQQRGVSNMPSINSSLVRWVF